MKYRTVIATLGVVFMAGGPLHAQEEERNVPPENAMSVSEIVSRVEARDDFRYLDEVDWDEQGYYEIVYFTADKARVEMKINPLTGEPI